MWLRSSSAIVTLQDATVLGFQFASLSRSAVLAAWRTTRRKLADGDSAAAAERQALEIDGREKSFKPTKSDTNNQFPLALLLL